MRLSEYGLRIATATERDLFDQCVMVTCDYSEDDLMRSLHECSEGGTVDIYQAEDFFLFGFFKVHSKNHEDKPLFRLESGGRFLYIMELIGFQEKIRPFYSIQQANGFTISFIRRFKQFYSQSTSGAL